MKYDLSHALEFTLFKYGASKMGNNIRNKLVYGIVGFAAERWL
jgi:hypothetical protein